MARVIASLVAGDKFGLALLEQSPSHPLVAVAAHPDLLVGVLFSSALIEAQPSDPDGPTLMALEPSLQMEPRLLFLAQSMLFACLRANTAVLHAAAEARRIAAAELAANFTAQSELSAQPTESNVDPALFVPVLATMSPRLVPDRLARWLDTLSAGEGGYGTVCDLTNAAVVISSPGAWLDWPPIAELIAVRTTYFRGLVSEAAAAGDVDGLEFTIRLGGRGPVGHLVGIAVAVVCGCSFAVIGGCEVAPSDDPPAAVSAEHRLPAALLAGIRSVTADIVALSDPARRAWADASR
eukprot:c1052_g1_i1.p1 GENE.c1052_g1_i1~~c1052_g1_i1.p1  ORF type:complete len:335 (+),score=24.26 c1052_g1_i1:123-1007(+)